MITYSFYYFLGFVLTFLGTSWKPTLALNVILLIFAQLFADQYSIRPFCLLIGWAAAIPVPSHFLYAKAEIFTLAAASHMNILIFTLEVIVCILTTSIVFSYDNSLTLWTLMMLIHCFYVMGLMLISRDLNLIKRDSTTRLNYYYMLMIGLIVSDLVFFLSCFIFNHGSTIYSTCIAAAASVVCSFIIDKIFHMDEPPSNNQV